MKNCENCYWYHREECFKRVTPPIQGDCEEYGYECSSCNLTLAHYKQGDLYYCQDCFLGANDIETFTVTHYTWDGEYMGSEDNIDEVIEYVIDNLDEEVEIL